MDLSLWLQALITVAFCSVFLAVFMLVYTYRLARQTERTVAKLQRDLLALDIALGPLSPMAFRCPRREPAPPDPRQSGNPIEGNAP